MEARRLAALDELVDEDDLVQAAQVEDPHLIDTAVRSLALEIAELGWQVRRARARRTAAASKLAGQRIRALARVAGLVLLKARERFHHADEPPDELVETVRELFLNEVLSTARDTLGEPLANELLRRVLAKLGGANAVKNEVEVRSDL